MISKFIYRQVRKSIAILDRKGITEFNDTKGVNRLPTEIIYYPLPAHDSQHGNCFMCGELTDKGVNLAGKNKFVSSNLFGDRNNSFTNWSLLHFIPIRIKDKHQLQQDKALEQQYGRVICPYCVMMMRYVDTPAGKTPSLQMVFKQRLKLSLIDSTGQIFSLGTKPKIKWMLNNINKITPPFVWFNNKNGKNFCHRLWSGKLSLSTDLFYLCENNVNHQIRLNRVIEEGFDDLTEKELYLRAIMTDTNKKTGEPFISEETALHPFLTLSKETK